MMMTLRSQMKLILWILVVAFLATIVFSWGMGGFKEKSEAGIVGRIDKTEIQYQDFVNYQNQLVNRATNQEDKELSENEIKQIRENAWDQYIEAILKQEDAERLGVKVTDREIAHIVQNYPPAEVQNVEMFQNEGEFDLQAYQNFLRQASAVQFLVGLEQSVRNYLLEQKLNHLVMQAADVPGHKVLDEYIKGAVVGKLEFIVVIKDSVNVDSSVVTEEMMKKYYRTFPDRFKEYPKARFAYVKFKLEPSGQDSADILREAETIMREIRSGEDFAELARVYSEDPGSGEKGGDLGWFGRGKMVKAFEEAAFAAEPGDLLGPIESRYGLHIIEVLDKRTGDEGEEEINARHILLNLEPSIDTREEVYNEAYNFAQDIDEFGWETIVRENGYEVDTTKSFSQAGYVTGLGRMRMAAEFCFDNPVGTLSEVFNVPDGYVVFKIVEVTEEGTKPFEDVKTTILKSLFDIQREHKAWDIAGELRAKIESPDDLKSVGESMGYHVYVTDDSIRSSASMPGGLRRDSDFMTEAFRLEEGELSGIIEGRRGYYIAHMIFQTPINEEEFAAARPTIYQSLVQQEQNSLIRNWIRELRVAADIQDYRYRYFRDF